MKRQANNFGDIEKLLKKQMDCIDELANFRVEEGRQKVKDILVSLKNSLKDVLFLVQEHKLTTKLYQKQEISNIVEKFLSWLAIRWSKIQAKFPKGTENKAKWEKFVEENLEVQRCVIMHLQMSKSEDVKSPR